MSEFDGLWKHQNNPACTKSVSRLQNVEVDIVQKKWEDQNCDLDRTIYHFPSVWKVGNNKTKCPYHGCSTQVPKTDNSV